MPTHQVDRSETEWVVPSPLYQHRSDAVLNAPAHRIHTYQQPFDFAQFSFISGQRVWVRSTRGNAFLYVTRAVTVFTGFVPLGSDRLITSDANIFLVQEA